MIKTALSIAGFDPTSGAGITSDIKTFHAFGVYGIGVLSSLTVQNTLGVRRVKSIPKSFLRDQLDALLMDIVPDAAKSGMLYNREVMQIICDKLDLRKIKNMIVDPVITSSSGKKLITKDALSVLVNELIPRCKMVTPNINEAEIITGLKIHGKKEIYASAEKLYKVGAECVIIKGGHMKDTAVDVLFDGERFYEFKSQKITGQYHGTGCVFSAALTANLAIGKGVIDSVKCAKAFTRKSIKSAVDVGKGMKLLGI